jgi:hypothetical protein
MQARQGAASKKRSNEMTRTLFVAIALLVIATTLIAAQAPSSVPVQVKIGVAENFTPPRTPWGDPDLQGNLTNLYEAGTPLERPDRFEGRRLEDIKGEELALIRREIQARSTDNRLDAGGVQGGTPEIWLSAYEHEKGSMAWLVVDPPNGKIPPLTPQAAARRGGARGGGGGAAGGGTAAPARTRGPADSYEDRSLYDRCTSRGLPNSMMPTLYGNSYQIIQGPGYVAIRYEMIHETRIIPLDNRPHLNSTVRQWMGDARGRWEGNTLVVETTNFREDMTPRGANPDTLRLIERFTRVAPDKIQWYVTFDDPQTWTRPWTYMVMLTVDDSQAIAEYACHEANYSLWNILRGHRAEEHAGR